MEEAALRDELIASARGLVARDGAGALTMRRMAEESGRALGLPYTVFADRSDLVRAVVEHEFGELASRFEQLAQRAGSHTVGGNLAWIADVMLDSPAVALAHAPEPDHDVAGAVADTVERPEMGPAAFVAAVESYLAAEQSAGRVREDVDTRAFAFVIAGAIHNLVVAGDGYPRPSRRRMRGYFEGIALAVGPLP